MGMCISQMLFIDFAFIHHPNSMIIHFVLYLNTKNRIRLIMQM